MNLERTEKSIADEFARIADHWGFLLALGIILGLIGLLALGSLVVATLATVTFLGAVLLVGGIVDVVTAFTSRRWRGFGMSLLSGIVAAVVGILLIARPAAGAGVLTLLLALLFLASGISRIIFSSTERFPSWGWSLASGIVAVILGLFVLFGFPSTAIWFLGLVVAVELLMRGLLWIAMAFSLHRAAPELRRAAAA